MKPFKICVYAIAKNEEKFVERWVNSMSEADEIYVLDTGSTDKTVELLRNKGVNVVARVISPWRFDAARNFSLQMVPKDTDICVCTDLDEVFTMGWRAKLEEEITGEFSRIRYKYVWSFNEDGSDGVVYWGDKIHKRNGYIWSGAVHEVLKWNADVPEAMEIYANSFSLLHYPDNNKSRGQYLPLLEKAVEEEPENDRNVHYLGREYMYYGRFDDSIRVLKQHLSLKSSTWKDERCASMRFIARDYTALNNLFEAQRWYMRAVAEAPYLREPWLDFAMFAQNNKDWHLVAWLISRALEIKERPRTYINEAACWGSLPYDLASIAYYNLGEYEKAVENINYALEIEPKNERFINNQKIINNRENYKKAL